MQTSDHEHSLSSASPYGPGGTEAPLSPVSQLSHIDILQLLSIETASPDSDIFAQSTGLELSSSASQHSASEIVQEPAQETPEEPAQEQVTPSAPTTPAPPQSPQNPPPDTTYDLDSWSSPIDFTYYGSTVANAPDKHHWHVTRTATILTHTYTCPVQALDWDKVIANLLQWCSLGQQQQQQQQNEDTRLSPSSSTTDYTRHYREPRHPPRPASPVPIHGIIKCAPFVQIFTELSPTRFPTLAPRHAGRFARFQHKGQYMFRLTDDIDAIPSLYHEVIMSKEPEYEPQSPEAVFDPQ
ncbi:uncharacterized protein BO97DRAFT_419892 [Aspergillus homomorphus CBS 101889]|uniref:Uncharacterized protein n=1 Tax=Aspergillus homomorphus (strain CBS 101889) TaxID=1450537 RepID=A0A395ICV6_ASPHC|nr:hypothetical protein BO97DRAFT_419892 [Aspergillus homomorphus CBS 101889]RAL17659.1 hypothetical protein BO97DRAFT_419892 [Aspergillus homomorphus CBS 101889]